MHVELYLFLEVDDREVDRLRIQAIRLRLPHKHPRIGNDNSDRDILRMSKNP